jgi:mono/diheme cytochrome c family protein
MATRSFKTAAGLLAACALLSACGEQKVSLDSADSGKDSRINQGAEIFADKCSGCHTIASAGTQGSAVKIRDRERTDGPNFDTRREDVDSVLYAIRNGGFSGAIMPENIVVGDDAQKVAEYLAKYAGREAD